MSSDGVNDGFFRFFLVSGDGRAFNETDGVLKVGETVLELFFGAESFFELMVTQELVDVGGFVVTLGEEGGEVVRGLGGEYRWEGQVTDLYAVLDVALHYPERLFSGLSTPHHQHTLRQRGFQLLQSTFQVHTIPCLPSFLG